MRPPPRQGQGPLELVPPQEPRPDRPSCPADVPIESLRLRFALLQSLNTTLETFFLPLVELRQTPMYTRSIAALLKEAKGQHPAQCLGGALLTRSTLGPAGQHLQPRAVTSVAL